MIRITHNKNRLISFYAIAITFAMIYLAVTGYYRPNSKEFDEITVERINIVEPDGALKMVISNAERQHPGMFDGEEMENRKRPAGMIFFNEEQDEIGGLIYEGNKDGAGMVLSFDQYKNDQIMQMQYLRAGENQQQYGLNIWDRSENMPLPKIIRIIDSLESAGITDFKQQDSILLSMNKNQPVDAQRLFTGKTFDGNVGLFVKDQKGNNRIKIYVDQKGNPIIEFLDENEEVINRLPKSKKS